MITRYDIGNKVYFQWGDSIFCGRVKSITITQEVYYTVGDFKLLSEDRLHDTVDTVLEIIKQRVIDLDKTSRL